MISILMDDMHLDLILLGACEKNKASLTMIEKLGFHFEGRRHKAFWDLDENKPVDLIYYYKDRIEEVSHES
jgi:RimJ/RimL family protein N-acetyltransferase